MCCLFVDYDISSYLKMLFLYSQVYQFFIDSGFLFFVKKEEFPYL